MSNGHARNTNLDITSAGESSAQIQSGNSSIESVKSTTKVSIQIGDSLHVLSGSDVFIDCLASGTPRPAINWRWDGRRVISGSRRGQYAITDITDGSRLTVWQMTSENAGQYECIAFNTGGADRIASTITVIGTVNRPFFILSFLLSYNYILGSRSTLRVEVCHRLILTLFVLRFCHSTFCRRLSRCFPFTMGGRRYRPIRYRLYVAIPTDLNLIFFSLKGI